MNKTIESLHILRFLNTLIGKYLKALKTDVKDHVDSNSLIYFGVKSQILILACSYIDEWDNFLASKKNDKMDQRLIELKKQAKPAIDRIREWTGLKEFRNTVLAHNFRNKKLNFESVFTNDYTDYLKIPDHITEIYLLSKCLDIATKIVCVPFRTSIESTKNEFFRMNKKVEVRIVDWEKELIEIINKIKI
ncbi:MAG: hypothetical protein K8R68_00635 [Bacteroidales bacterium]|nr:hypothetical protein [Bacteroidales bacterium]